MSPKPRAKPVFTTMVPDGHEPPDPKHVKQVRKVLAAFYNLPPEAAKLFCRSLIHDESCMTGELFASLTKSLADSTQFHKSLFREIFSLQDQAYLLQHKLSKHRRPPRNKERDAEIMRLHREGKTAGQIVLDLADRWPLTDRQVTAVISRESKKKSPVK